METALLKLFEDSDNWKYLDSIQQSQVSTECFIIIQDIKEYTQHNNTLDWDDFSTWFCVVKHPSYSRDKLDIYRNFITNTKEYTDTNTTEAVLEALSEREVATQISDIALSVASGEGVHALSEIHPLLDTVTLPTVTFEEVTHDIEDLEETFTTSGLEWRLDCLNQAIGPVNKGDMILIAARPEVGKTSFLTSEATHMLSQLPEDKCIVWFCNEEAGTRVRWRIIQALLNKTTAEITADKAQANADYKAAGGHRIRLIDNHDLNFHDIKSILQGLNPGLIIYDQLRNVRGFERSSTDVERLKCLYREARATAQLAPSITVHQARGDAEGELWLHQNQLEGVQTEVQGALDVQVMLGRSHDPSYDDNLRGLSIVKNKLTGGASTDPSKRHGKFNVYIDAERGRYYE
jgi:replicative DNA helicase